MQIWKLFKKKINKDKKPNFTWDGWWGPIRCMACNRPLEQSEVKITYCSNSWGDMRHKGKAKCRICGNSYKWNNTWW